MAKKKTTKIAKTPRKKKKKIESYEVIGSFNLCPHDGCGNTHSNEGYDMLDYGLVPDTEENKYFFKFECKRCESIIMNRTDLKRGKK